MSDWTTTPVTDVLEFREGPGIMAVDFQNSGVPLIRLAGLKSGVPLLTGCNFLSHDKVLSKWSHFRVQAGDVLLSTSASLGEVAVVDEASVGAIPYTGIVGFRSKSPRLHQVFVRHLLTSPSFAYQIEAMGVGSVMKHFGPMHLRQMSVSFPSVQQQRAIAAILAALDDKIVANTVQATTADDLAAAIFRDRSSQVAMSSRYEEVAAIGGGGTPSTKDPGFWGGELQWATPTDVTALSLPYLSATSRRITQAGLDACASPMYPKGSILMTSRATIGAFAIAEMPTAVNQGFIVAVPYDHHLDMWLFYEMRSRINDYLAVANGATFMELSRGRFKVLPVRLAAPEVMSQFGEDVRPLVGMARHSQRENVTLAELRDTLLPALMSGRLRVKDAERHVEDAV